MLAIIWLLNMIALNELIEDLKVPTTEIVYVVRNIIDKKKK